MEAVEKKIAPSETKTGKDEGFTATVGLKQPDQLLDVTSPTKAAEESEVAEEVIAGEDPEKNLVPEEKESNPEEKIESLVETAKESECEKNPTNEEKMEVENQQIMEVEEAQTDIELKEKESEKTDLQEDMEVDGEVKAMDSVEKNLMEIETKVISATLSAEENSQSSKTDSSKRSATPERLVSMLLKLPPEKYAEMCSQILANSSKSGAEKAPNVTTEGKVAQQEELPEAAIVEASNQRVDSDDDDCIVLSDSDDEPKKAESSDTSKDTEEVKQEPMKIEEAIEATVCEQVKVEAIKVERPQSSAKTTTKECIVTDCPRESKDFLEAPNFLYTMSYVPFRKEKIQYVCADCHESAVQHYEKMCEAMLNNRPFHSIPIPKKLDTVEIIDSDEEEDQTNGVVAPVPDSEKIDFDAQLEDEIEKILQMYSEKIDFNKQFQSEEESILKRTEKLELENQQIEDDMRMLGRKSLEMYNELYSINKQPIQRKRSVDLTTVDQPKPRNIITSDITIKLPDRPTQNSMRNPASKSSQQSQPSAAQSATPKISLYYAVRQRAEVKEVWAPCRLLDTISSDESKKYKVEFVEGSPFTTVVTAKEFASNEINENLKVGSRVIARFFSKNQKGKLAKGRYLPGVIGEKLSKYNKFRYLVFCDYGQVQYVPASDVLEIVESSPNVWEDVHPNLRQFIQEYLQSQTLRSRPLLTVRPSQRVQTERNGTWRNGVVHEIDCSVVRMYFPDESVYEWLYRGSKRLGPLYTQGHREHLNNARRNDPSIEYTQIGDDDGEEKTKTDEADIKRNTARKSTSAALKKSAPAAQAPTNKSAPAQVPATSNKTIILNDNFVYLDEPVVVLKSRHFTPKAGIEAKKYVAHQCSPSCLPPQTSTLSTHTPLSKPLLTCWERQIIKHKYNKWIQYKAPCGRILHNIEEVHRYLNITKCFLNVDNFSFECSMQVLADFSVNKSDEKLFPLFIPDLSEGKEGMKIPVLNAFDSQRPPPLEYSPARIPMEGVHINTDPEFLACCDCTDDCSDKSKCACFQMTIRGFQFAHRNEGYADEDISYNYKRLNSQVSTGIYECTKNCPCNKRCFNRVVQNPIQVKMQLIRTKNRGWGLQSCHDIPKGTFICIYAGKLYREDDANALCNGLEHGDEYFAELDLIETATPLKEGFEAGVVYDDSESEKASDTDSDYENKSDDQEFVSKRQANGKREILTRSALNEKTRKASTDSDSDAEMVSMMPSDALGNEVQQKQTRSLRKLYGKNEKVYIMDAKNCGNVGRYFNHSCDPNMFVQSVYVDTHDMRFPWIAFFSMRPIKASEELTWNYNYEVGSVPSKILICNCGAKNCRGRIL